MNHSLALHCNKILAKVIDFYEKAHIMDLCPKFYKVGGCMLREIFYSTSVQKILYFLLAHPHGKYYDREVSRLAKVGRAAANYSLRTLIDTGLIEREKKGRMYFYYANFEDPFIKQLKVTQNLIDISQLVKELKSLSLKIILYGSAATGANHAESDVDLFVLTRDVKKIKDIIYKSRLEKKLQHVIVTPQDFVKLKKNNPVFYKEIATGIILHEEKK